MNDSHTHITILLSKYRWFIGSAKKDERIEDAMKFLIDEIKKQQNIREEKRKNKPKSPLKGMQLTAGDGMRSNSDKCVLL